MSDTTTALEEHVALVTGASSGIGRATAEQLAEAGASVALAARREDELEALAREIEADGGEALVVPTDLTDEEQVEAMVETTAAEPRRAQTCRRVGTIHERTAGDLKNPTGVRDAVRLDRRRFASACCRRDAPSGSHSLFCRTH